MCVSVCIFVVDGASHIAPHDTNTIRQCSASRARTEQIESSDRVVGVARIKPALIDSTISVFQILQ